MILDNARYYRNKKVMKYIQSSKIEVIFLPPYSPNLNLIERLWKFMRIKVINNKFYEKFTVFKEAILGFFKNSVNHKEELASFIGTRMHLIKN